MKEDENTPVPSENAEPTEIDLRSELPDFPPGNVDEALMLAAYRAGYNRGYDEGYAKGKTMGSIQSGNSDATYKEGYDEGFAACRKWLGK